MEKKKSFLVEVTFNDGDIILYLKLFLTNIHHPLPTANNVILKQPYILKIPDTKHQISENERKICTMNEINDFNQFKDNL